MNCKIHGHTEPAILCNHLAEAGKDNFVYIGWVQASYDPDNREQGDLMAWCNDCHRVFEADDGWNEHNDAHFKMVCELCFDAIQENQHKLYTVK